MNVFKKPKTFQDIVDGFFTSTKDIETALNIKKELNNLMNQDKRTYWTEVVEWIKNSKEDRKTFTFINLISEQIMQVISDKNTSKELFDQFNSVDLFSRIADTENGIFLNKYLEIFTGNDLELMANILCYEKDFVINSRQFNNITDLTQKEKIFQNIQTICEQKTEKALQIKTSILNKTDKPLTYFIIIKDEILKEINNNSYKTNNFFNSIHDKLQILEIFIENQPDKIKSLNLINFSNKICDLLKNKKIDNLTLRSIISILLKKCDDGSLIISKYKDIQNAIESMLLSIKTYDHEKLLLVELFKKFITQERENILNESITIKYKKDAIQIILDNIQITNDNGIKIIESKDTDLISIATKSYYDNLIKDLNKKTTYSLEDLDTIFKIKNINYTSREKNQEKMEKITKPLIQIINKIKDVKIDNSVYDKLNNILSSDYFYTDNSHKKDFLNAINNDNIISNLLKIPTKTYIDEPNIFQLKNIASDSILQKMLKICCKENFFCISNLMLCNSLNIKELIKPYEDELRKNTEYTLEQLSKSIDNLKIQQNINHQQWEDLYKIIYGMSKNNSLDDKAIKKINEIEHLICKIFNEDLSIMASESNDTSTVNTISAINGILYLTKLHETNLNIQKAIIEIMILHDKNFINAGILSKEHLLFFSLYHESPVSITSEVIFNKIKHERGEESANRILQTMHNLSFGFGLYNHNHEDLKKDFRKNIQSFNRNTIANAYSVETDDDSMFLDTYGHIDKFIKFIKKYKYQNLDIQYAVNNNHYQEKTINTFIDEFIKNDKQSMYIFLNLNQAHHTAIKLEKNHDGAKPNVYAYDSLNWIKSRGYLDSIKNMTNVHILNGAIQGGRGDSNNCGIYAVHGIVKMFEGNFDKSHIKGQPDSILMQFFRFFIFLQGPINEYNNNIMRLNKEKIEGAEKEIITLPEGVNETVIELFLNNTLSKQEKINKLNTIRDKMNNFKITKSKWISDTNILNTIQHYIENFKTKVQNVIDNQNELNDYKKPQPTNNLKAMQQKNPNVTSLEDTKGNKIGTYLNKTETHLSFTKTEENKDFRKKVITSVNSALNKLDKQNQEPEIGIAMMDAMIRFKNSHHYKSFVATYPKRVGFSEMIKDPNFKEILLFELQKKEIKQYKNVIFLDDKNIKSLRQTSGRMQNHLGNENFGTAPDRKFSRTDFNKMNSFRQALLLEACNGFDELEYKLKSGIAIGT